MSELCEESTELKSFFDNDDYDNLLIEINNSTSLKEPEFIEFLPLLLEKIGDRKYSEKAQKCGEAIISKMNPFAMKVYMNILYNELESLKWQIKKGA